MKEENTVLTKNSISLSTSSYQLEVGLNSSCLEETIIECGCFPCKAWPRWWKLSIIIQIRPKSSLPPCLFSSSAKRPLWVLSCGQTKSRPFDRAASSIAQTLGELLSHQGTAGLLKLDGYFHNGSKHRNWRRSAKWPKSDVAPWE